MMRIIEDELVDVVTGALVGVIDVEDGPTDEQCAVLQAIVTGYWVRSGRHRDEARERGGRGRRGDGPGGPPAAARAHGAAGAVPAPAVGSASVPG